MGATGTAGAGEIPDGADAADVAGADVAGAIAPLDAPDVPTIARADDPGPTVGAAGAAMIRPRKRKPSMSAPSAATVSTARRRRGRGSNPRGARNHVDGCERRSGARAGAVANVRREARDASTGRCGTAWRRRGEPSRAARELESRNGTAPTVARAIGRIVRARAASSANGTRCVDAEPEPEDVP
ncbi:MAG: hypothetical protein NVSMB21_17160 [Vulcanimicrobiaceae bacterium]